MKTYFPPRKALNVFLCSTFNVKMSSSSDVIAASAPSPLVSLGASRIAVVLYCISSSSLSMTFKTS